MKRLILAFALLLGATSMAAQKFQFGIVGGLNLTKLSLNNHFKDTFSSDNRAGFYIGPKLNFSTFLGIGGDIALEYSNKKVKVNSDAENTAEASSTFHSIEIPINLRYNIGLGSLASIYLATGPQFGFNIGDKKWDTGSFPSNHSPLKFEKKNMNTSWNIGAGVRLIRHLEVGLLYNIALSNYLKKAGSDDYNFKTNTFQVQVAYMF